MQRVALETRSARKGYESRAFIRPCVEGTEIQRKCYREIEVRYRKEGRSCSPHGHALGAAFDMLWWEQAIMYCTPLEQPLVHPSKNSSMIYLQLTPCPQLRPWIRFMWYCRAPRVPRRRERVLPDGCMQIIVNLSHNFLTDCGEDGTATVRLPRAIV